MPRKRKIKPMPFNKEYFQNNRPWFNPSFLAKYPVERSGMLAKYYRKLAHTNRALSNINRWIRRQEDKTERLETADEKAKKEFLRKIFTEKENAESIARSLFKDAASIFSEEYARAITSSQHVKTPEQNRLHECHKFLYKNGQVYDNIKERLFD